MLHVRRCFGLSRFSTVRNVLYYLGFLPLNVILDERRVLLLKDCLTCAGIINVLACMNVDNCDFYSTCCKYDVHCAMSKCDIKNCIKDKSYNDLYNEGLV